MRRTPKTCHISPVVHLVLPSMETINRDQGSETETSVPILTSKNNEEVRESDVDEAESDTLEEGWLGWFVVLASFLCNMVIDGMGYSFGVLLEPLKEDFQTGAGSVAVVGSILAGVIMLTGPGVFSVKFSYFIAFLVLVMT